MKQFQEILEPLRSFQTIVTGNTLGAHHAFIRKLEAIGQTEVASSEYFDYFLVFCPIVPRVGTDISEALEKIPRIPPGKPAVLVVMHHTINADSYVGESRRHVNRPDIILTVDCVFHEGHFLNCSRNDTAFREIEGVVGRCQSQVFNVENSWRTLWNTMVDCFRDYKCIIIFVMVILFTAMLLACITRH